MKHCQIVMIPGVTKNMQRQVTCSLSHRLYPSQTDAHPCEMKPIKVQWKQLAFVTQISYVFRQNKNTSITAQRMMKCMLLMNSSWMHDRFHIQGIMINTNWLFALTQNGCYQFLWFLCPACEEREERGFVTLCGVGIASTNNSIWENGFPKGRYYRIICLCVNALCVRVSHNGWANEQFLWCV